MNFFAVTSYVVFCLTLINTWLEKFLEYNLSKCGYLWYKFFKVTHSSQFDAHQAFKTYTNGVIFFLGAFGVNAILHSFEIQVLPLTIVTFALNILCFFLHCGYVACLPFHISQDYTSVLQLGYNFVMWMYLNYVYFFTPSYVMYFKYFIIMSIPYLFRAYFNLVDYHYNGSNTIIKTLDIYLNYF